jgi:hypothetical protein
VISNFVLIQIKIAKHRYFSMFAFALKFFISLGFAILVTACSASSGRIGSKKQTTSAFTPTFYITNMCLEGASDIVPISANVIATEDQAGGPLRTNSVSTNLVLVSGVGID